MVAKLIGLMVTKDEADHYLIESLDALAAAVEEIVVFDDQSSDATVKIARSYGAKVCIRDTHTDTFLCSESNFREASWRWMERAVRPTPESFVAVVDADELLLSVDGNTKGRFQDLRGAAGDATGILIQKYECWGFDDDGTPLIRVDGMWGKIIGTRIVRWQPGGVYSGRRMASGSEPTYVTKKIHRDSNGLFLLHYAYATPEGRARHYDRYMSLPDHMHSSQHIESIMDPNPVLERFKLWNYNS